MSQICAAFTNAQLQAIVLLREEGKSFTWIAAEYDSTKDSVQKAYKRYGHFFKDGKAKKVKTPRPKPVKKKAEDNSCILVISDMHIPYQHPDTLAFLTAIKKKYNPTRVVCVGDEVDHHAMSFHDSDPDLLSAGDELRRAVKELQPFYKLFPEVDLIDSNHGSMAYRKGKHHGIPRKYLRDYGDVLDAPAGWVWAPELILKMPNGTSVFFHHGLSKDVMKVVAQRGLCTVQGHYHTEFRIGYLGTPEALLWGMNVGCSIDGYSLAFAYDKTNLGRPVIGHGIIIDGQPRLLPMVLKKGGRWNGVVP